MRRKPKRRNRWRRYEAEKKALRKLAKKLGL